MSKEELYKALKMFDREDLIYENNELYHDFEEYMGTMKQEKGIQVFMSIEDMVKYSKLEQEIERLHSIIKEARKYIENNNIYSNKKIDDVLEILNKGSDKEC